MGYHSNIQANKPVFIVYVPYNVTKDLVQQEDSLQEAMLFQ